MSDPKVCGLFLLFLNSNAAKPYFLARSLKGDILWCCGLSANGISTVSSSLE